MARTNSRALPAGTSLLSLGCSRRNISSGVSSSSLSCSYGGSSYVWVRYSNLAHFALLIWPPLGNPGWQNSGMDRRRKVELFEEIRRDFAAGKTIKGLAKKYGVHRRMEIGRASCRERG